MLPQCLMSLMFLTGRSQELQRSSSTNDALESFWAWLSWRLLHCNIGAFEGECKSTGNNATDYFQHFHLPSLEVQRYFSYRAILVAIVLLFLSLFYGVSHYYRAICQQNGPAEVQCEFFSPNSGVNLLM